MILELDCGNTLIKWRVIEAGHDRVIGSGVVGSDDELVARLKAIPRLQLRHCRLVSVRTDEETERLMASLQVHFGVVPVMVRPAERLGSVTNGYEQYQRLGLDRWMAIVGGYRLARGACLVLDLGTAVTSDLVNSDGAHVGGFICPGISMMRNQLRTHTRRIRYDDLAAERALQAIEPGRSTVEAVERGCLLMLQGFVKTQIDMAHQAFGESFTVFLTGGDAVLVQDVLPEAKVVPDLVFVGLAIACPLS